MTYRKHHNGDSGERSAQGRSDFRMSEFVLLVILSAKYNKTGVASIAESGKLSASSGRSVGVRTAYNDLTMSYEITRLTELTILGAVR